METQKEEPAEKLLSKYTKLSFLSQDTCGCVYLAKENDTNKQVVMKALRIDEDDGILSSYIRQISLLRELDHINVVRLLDVVHNSKKLHIIFEHLDGDLSQQMSYTSLGESLTKYYMYQLLSGTAYCHARGVIHRDLKPVHLLIDRQNTILKLAGFGLARSISIPVPQYTHEVVTLWYRAPEILLGSTTYSPAVDVWAIGCIFAEMVSNKPLFPGNSEIDQLMKIFLVLGTPTEASWPGVSGLPDYSSAKFPQWQVEGQMLSKLLPLIGLFALDLLQRLLHYNPAKRISAKEALDHPYFEDIAAVIRNFETTEQG